MLKSNHSIKPTANNVLVKLVYSMNTLSLVAAPSEKDMNAKAKTYVVATGESCGLKVNGEILTKETRCVCGTPPQVRVDLDENERTMFKLHNIFAKMPDDELKVYKKANQETEVVEYAMYNEFSIIAFYE